MRIALTGSPFSSLVLVLLGVAIPSASSAKDPYWIRAKPTVTGPYSIVVAIETNIPGQPVLSVNLALRGQKPTDVFIGTQFARVPIADGRGTVAIDGQKRAQPEGSPLPKGAYDLELAFYPMWDENKAIAASAGIKQEVEAKFLVTLGGSGASPASAQLRQEGQKWVISSVPFGSNWEPSLWTRKFGKPKTVPYRGSSNPRVFHMYYFPSIDMTLMVNEVTQKIVLWRMGLAGE